MKKLATRAAISLLGMAITLGWWSLRGNSGSADHTLEKIPAAVWEGGGSRLTIEAEVSDPARINAAFHGPAPSGDERRYLEAWENISAGRHSWTIALPAGTGGVLDLGIPEPKIGSRISWTVTLNGQTIVQESDALEKPLEAGYAFGLQANLGQDTED
ncbi:MAG TPA: hypothetical protein VGQ71_11090 [Terriglobales bacterium]|jgi:hypothetical protein|nr:hypothetical protein [Terriglobales bacterium]